MDNARIVAILNELTMAVHSPEGTTDDAYRHGEAARKLFEDATKDAPISDSDALQVLYNGAMRWVLKNALSKTESNKVMWAPNVEDVDTRAQDELQDLLIAVIAAKEIHGKQN